MRQRCDARSSIVWDKFVFPQMDQEFWREEALCYRPGKTLNVGVCMTGFRLMLQDDKGQYPNSGRALIFEGSMLVYDPQHDSAQWVPIWGTSATLTMTELRTANDLNNMVPLLYSEVELARPPSPEIIKGIPVGAKSDTDSSAIDSGDEWDKVEVGVWLHCPTPNNQNRPHLGRGPCCHAGRGGGQKPGLDLGYF